MEKSDYKRCVIIASSPTQYDFSLLRSSLALSDSDFIIACDGGYEHAKRNGLTPDLIIGDFDSYKGELPESEDGKPAIIRAKPEKDDSDTMLSIKYAFSKGYRDILLLCATGGRFDHTFANIQCAKWIAENDGQCTIVDGECEIHTLTERTSPLTFDTSFWKGSPYIFSVFSLTDKSTGVFEKGVKYPLENATLTSGFPLGISNEILLANHKQNAQISVSKGILLVVFTIKV